MVNCFFLCDLISCPAIPIIPIFWGRVGHDSPHGHQFLGEVATDGDVSTAIHRTFHGVGTALIMTTVVLLAGFSSVLMSEMPVHRVFATMAVSTIGTALIGDLLILPALLASFGSKTESTTKESNAA